MAIYFLSVCFGGTSFLGNAVPRREDLSLLQGKGGYVANIPMEGAVYAHFVRSSISHGEIVSVETSEALNMQGVIAAYTAENLGLADREVILKAYEAGMTRPYLARGRVRFAGEPIAVVLAESEYLAADAAEKHCRLSPLAQPLLRRPAFSNRFTDELGICIAVSLRQGCN